MNRLGVIFAVGCLVAAAAAADVITMRNGQTIYGTYIGGNARQLRLDVGGGQIQTFDIGQVQSISFGDSQSQAGPPNGAASGYAAPPAAPPPQYAAAPPPPPPPSGGLTIPADTRVTVRMIDSVDSETARLGQTYRASLDEPIEVNGQVVAPRGADVLTKLVQDQKSGKIEGRTAVTLALVNISINGQQVPVTSTDLTQQSGSQSAKSAKVIGGTAALGTIIGALAGGGKGAAIGAVSGAGAGGAVQVLTSGQRVRIPSETRLTFRLQNPVQL